MMHSSGCCWRITGIAMFGAVAAAAQAQTPQAQWAVEQESAADPAVLLSLPYSTRLAWDAPLWPDGRLGRASAVLTADYRARTLEEQNWRESRFGVRPVDPMASNPYFLHESRVPGRLALNFVQELRWPGRPLAGVAFERRDFLFRGDRLSIRSTSDLQTLARGIGLSGSDTEAGMLSLLGWRSHSRLLWQWGEPTRELQWKFSAGMDRRAAVQSGSVNLQMVRRF